MPTRNVINVSDVELFVDDFAKQTDHPALKRWLASTVRRWILKHYDRADRIVLDPKRGGFARAGVDGALRPLDIVVPDWCATAIERGDDVVYLRLGATLRKRVRAALCRCGLSSNKPYCDSSHAEGGFRDSGAVGRKGEGNEDKGGELNIKPAPNGPLLVRGNLEIRAASGRSAWYGQSAALCRCGASQNKPFCDGSHKAVGFSSE